jgi:hypothetical protein
MPDEILCACGCGKPRPRYIRGHAPKRVRQTLAERFWSKVDRRGPDDCWEWLGSRDKGYGKIGSGGRRGRPLQASRVSWEIHFGPIPDGLWVLHRCDNPPCVNPEHLFLGTRTDNIRDMHRKKRWAPNPVRGEDNCLAKLSGNQVREIRDSYQGRYGEKAALARRFGVSKNAIGNIIARKTWAHL